MHRSNSTLLRSNSTLLLLFVVVLLIRKAGSILREKRMYRAEDKWTLPNPIHDESRTEAISLGSAEEIKEILIDSVLKKFEGNPLKQRMPQDYIVKFKNGDDFYPTNELEWVFCIFIREEVKERLWNKLFRDDWPILEILQSTIYGYIELYREILRQEDFFESQGYYGSAYGLATPYEGSYTEAESMPLSNEEMKIILTLEVQRIFEGTYLEKLIPQDYIDKFMSGGDFYPATGLEWVFCIFIKREVKRRLEIRLYEEQKPFLESLKNIIKGYKKKYREILSSEDKVSEDLNPKRQNIPDVVYKSIYRSDGSISIQTLREMEALNALEKAVKFQLSLVENQPSTESFEKQKKFFKDLERKIEDYKENIIGQGSEQERQLELIGAVWNKVIQESAEKGIDIALLRTYIWTFLKGEDVYQNRIDQGIVYKIIRKEVNRRLKSTKSKKDYIGQLDFLNDLNEKIEKYKKTNV